MLTAIAEGSNQGTHLRTQKFFVRSNFMKSCDELGYNWTWNEYDEKVRPFNSTYRSWGNPVLQLPTLLIWTTQKLTNKKRLVQNKIAFPIIIL